MTEAETETRARKKVKMVKRIMVLAVVGLVKRTDGVWNSFQPWALGERTAVRDFGLGGKEEKEQPARVLGGRRT